MSRPFDKVLVANRGEIALRVLRTLREQGFSTVAVYSTADQSAPHVLEADEAILLGEAAATESYLRTDAILDAIRTTGAGAVHPGYGLLSENPGFAEAVVEAGAVFIGPPPSAMRAMATKTDARETMIAAGVPVVPGGDVSEADQIGFPVLVKATAGGGGKGMRRVDSAAELVDAVEACEREAAKAFGDGRVYVEKLIERPRHIEIQVLADAHGEVVHLMERECSIQRRHQKVIEECPSPVLTESLREAMGSAAVAAAKAVGYQSAGTVEFLVDEDGRFFFLEMNTRLQVEHPVTEMVLGVDLVAEQLNVAMGQPLRFSQSDLRPRGHAIECRVYAEDPQTFLPQAGTIQTLRVPEGPGIRHDSGIYEGWEVGVFYDPMLAKLCAWAPSREEAIQRMQRALADYLLLGVQTNLELLRHVVAHPAFAAGQTDTGFLAQHPFVPPDSVPDVAYIAATLARTLGTSHETTSGETAAGDRYSPWSRLGSWGRG